MNKLILFIAVTMSLTSFAGSKAQPQNDYVKPSIWLWGDSITYSYCYVLQPRMSYIWDSNCQGYGGETSAWGLTRMQSYVAQNPAPKVAVIMYGTNDSVHNLFMNEPEYTPAFVASNVLAMAELLKSKGTKVIIGYPLGVAPPRPEYGDKNNQALRAMNLYLDKVRDELRRRNPGFAVVDFQIQETRYFADAFHVNAEGNEILLGRIIPKIDANLR